MKNIFSKLMAMLLMAALFLPVACADYDEDIKNVQERLEALEEGEIDPAGVDVKELANQLTQVSGKLDQAIADHEADVKALEGVDAELSADVADLTAKLTVAEGLINSLDEEVEALKKADEDLAAAVKAGDDKLAVDLAAETAAREEAVAELVAMIEEVTEAVAEEFEGVQEALEAIRDTHAADIKDLDTRLATAEATIESLTDFAAQAMAIITNHEMAISSLTEELEGALDRVETLEGTVASLTDFAAQAMAIITNHEMAIQTLSDYKALLEEEIIPAMKEQITSNAGLIEIAIERLDLLVQSFTMLNNLVQDHAEEFAAYKEALAEELKEKFGEIGEALVALGDANIRQDKLISENQNLIAALQEQVALNNEAIMNLRADLLNEAALRAELQLNFEEFSQLVNATLLQHAADITNMQNGLEDLNNAYNKHVAEYKEFAEAMKTYVQEVNQIAQQNAQNITRIEETIEDLKSEFAAHEKAYEEFYMEYTEALVNLWGAIEATQADVDGLSEKVANLEAFESTAQGWMVSTDFRLESLDIAVEDLQNELAALRGEHEALEEAYGKFYQNVNVAIKAITDTNMEQDRVLKIAQDDITALDNELSTLETAFGEFANNFQEWASKLNDRLENIEGEMGDIKDDIADIQGNVADLLSRVQSIVYVPEYVDGKATVEWVTLDGTILGSTVTMTYQVYPEEAAAAIAYAVGAADADTESPLSYQFECLKTTRAAHGETAEIVEVGAMEGGRLVVKAALKGLQDAFFLGLSNDAVEGYAMSLVLNTEDGTNCSSCFTQLAPATQSIAAEVKLYRETAKGREQISGDLGVEKYMPYDLVGEEYRYTFIEGHYPVIALGDVEYTLEQFVAAGYEINLSNKPSKFVAASAGVYARNVAMYEGDPYGKLYYYTFYLDTMDERNIGTVITTTYDYHLEGSDNCLAQVSSQLEITKKMTSVDLGELVIDWNYVMDADVDADRLEGKDTFYNRDGLSIDLKNIVVEGLPEGTSLADALAYCKSYTINGQVVEDIMLGFNAENETLLVGISNFDWDETYNVEALFEIDNVILAAKLVIKTNNRYRGVITISRTTMVPYETDMVYAYNAENNPFGKFDLSVVGEDERITKTLGDVDVATWLTEAFADYDVLNNTIYAAYSNNFVDQNGEVKYAYADELELLNGWTTAHVIETAADGAVEASLGYDYRSFYNNLQVTDLPIAVLYHKTIDLWYGLEIQILQEVGFSLPKFDLNHTFYVFNDGEKYYSNVEPEYNYNPEEPALAYFSVAKVNMNAAFNVIGEGYTVTDPLHLDLTTGEAVAVVGDEQDVTYYLQAKFDLEKKYENIWMDNAIPNAIQYYGMDKYVDVTGALYLTSTVPSSNVKLFLQLPTSFDEGEIYSTYVVKQYDPLKQPVSLLAEGEYAESDVVDNAILYEINLYDYIEWMDDRREYGSFDLIADGAFVVGDGDNGFADQDKVTAVYGYSDQTGVFHNLEIDFVTTNANIPTIYKPFLKIDETTGIVSFDNSSQVELTQDITLDVTFIAKSAWNTYEVTIPCKFPIAK